MARIFFFTSLSGFHLHARTSRNLASKEPPTIREFPRAFNEERLQAFERPAVRATEAGILAALSLAPHNGGGEFQPSPEGCAIPAKKLSDAEITAPLPNAKSWSRGKGKMPPGFGWKGFRHAFWNNT